jgi:predicted nucleic acid-binding protein
MKVIVNATPLISLAILKRLDLLQQLFDEVIVPTAVYEEVVEQGAGRFGASEVAKANWLQIVSPSVTATLEPLLLGLDEGEMQVLLLAREITPDCVLIDEKLGRRVARALGFSLKGTLGLLLTAVLIEQLTKEQALDALQTLLAHGIRIAPRWQAWFEKELNER